MESIILSILVPVFTFLATKTAMAVKALPPWVVTSFIIPFAAGLGTWLSTLVNPDLAWYYAAGLSLAASYIHEFLNNIKKAIS
ncbi:MAG: hypothetical protein WC716_16855 [Chitinophagaceae bacterium]|jgi:hypothetical protein